MKTSLLSNRVKQISVSDFIVKFLRDNGIKIIYGTPGTSELSLMNSASLYGIEYYFTLHDTVAVGMADGFARSNKFISAVNLHSTQGLLNSLGFIRVAKRDNIPLLVIAGIPSTTYDIYEPNHYMMNLQQALSPVAKWVWNLSNIASLSEVFLRAISLALSPPKGPTIVCIPQDLLEKETSFTAIEKNPNTINVSEICSVASDLDIKRTVEILSKAKNPLIFSGYGSQNAVDEVELLADLISSPIIAESLDRGPQVHNVYCRTNHPLFYGFFDIRIPEFRNCIMKSDVIFFIGTKATYSKVIGELPKLCNIIQLSDNSNEIGKYFRVSISLCGNIKLSLKSLCDQLKIDSKSHISEKRKKVLFKIEGIRQKKNAEIASVKLHGNSICGMQLIKAMKDSLPSGAIIVDDSQCMGYYLKHYYEFIKPNQLFGSMASHIGWALSACLGVKIAMPSELVVCLVGDGSFMFGIQSLATAATYKIPVLVIIANNKGYISLKKEMAIKWKLTQKLNQNLSLNDPAFDYAQLSVSLGLKGINVFMASDLIPSIKSGLNFVSKEGKTCVINVMMSDSWEDWDESWYVK